MTMSTRGIRDSILLFLLIGLLAGCGPGEEIQTGMTEEEVTAHIRRSLTVYNQGDMGAVDELYSPDFVRRDSALPDDVVGLEAFKSYVGMLRTAYPDFRVTTDEVIPVGNRIILRWTVTGTHSGPLVSSTATIPPTDKSFSVSGVSIMTVMDGKNVEELVYYNQMAVYMQLGIVSITPPVEENPEKK